MTNPMKYKPIRKEKYEPQKYYLVYFWNGRQSWSEHGWNRNKAELEKVQAQLEASGQFTM